MNGGEDRWLRLSTPGGVSTGSTTGYDPHEFPPVALTVDLVVFAVVNKELLVALIERGEEPFKGQWALPGGFVRPDEDALAAAHRELAEETGLDLSAHRVAVEQLASYTAPDRDPRMRVVSVAHLVLLATNSSSLPELHAGTDAAAAQWHRASTLGTQELAFDHAEILSAAHARLAGKMEYTTIATELVDHEFTISALRDVYTAVWETDLPAGNFTRKLRTSLTPTGGKLQAKGAPASLFTKGGEWISPPMIRPEPKQSGGR